MSGRLGCNNVSGAYRMDGDVLVADKLAMTQMACVPRLMDQEQRLSDLLSSRPTVSSTPDVDRVVITSGEETLVLIGRPASGGPARRGHTVGARRHRAGGHRVERAGEGDVDAQVRRAPS